MKILKKNESWTKIGNRKKMQKLEGEKNCSLTNFSLQKFLTMGKNVKLFILTNF